MVAFPLAVITLLIVIGHRRCCRDASGAVGGVAVAVGLGIVYYVADVRDMSVLSFNIITLLGIGMGIDYSLFYVNRFKEETSERTGRLPTPLPRRTHGPGLPFLFSGVTSVIGLASLLLFDLTVLDSVGIGAVIVIAMALLSAQTLMPAVLSIVGHRINRLPVLSFARFGDGLWLKMADGVMRRPLLFLIPTVAILVSLAIPFKDIKPGTADATILPQTYESRRGFDLLRNEFGWDISTELIVAYTFNGDPFSHENLAKLYAFGQALEDIAHVDNVSSIVNLRPTLGIDVLTTIFIDTRSRSTTEQLLRLPKRKRPGRGSSCSTSVQISIPFLLRRVGLVNEIRAFDSQDISNVHVDGGAAYTSDLVRSLYGRFPIIAIIVIFADVLIFDVVVQVYRDTA